MAGRDLKDFFPRLPSQNQQPPGAQAAGQQPPPKRKRPGGLGALGVPPVAPLPPSPSPVEVEAAVPPPPPPPPLADFAFKASKRDRRVLEEDGDSPAPQPRPPRRDVVLDSPSDGGGGGGGRGGGGEAPAAIPVSSDDEVEEEAVEEEADVLAAVERIASDLRAALGGGVRGDRFSGGADGGDGGGEPGASPPGVLLLHTAADIAAACAPRVRGEEEDEEDEEEEEESDEDDDDDAPPLVPPPPLKAYQVVGVNFLALLRSRGLSAILADEMGLGKTAQAISFLALRAASGEEPRGPFLVVVPASLLDNWARELRTWAPSLRVAKYYGPHRERVRAEAKARARGGCDDPHGFDVALASYTSFSGDSSAARMDRKWLRGVPWSIVVLDEAHAVKNAAAARSAKLASVAAGADMRVCLTGTPLQNRPAELRALLAFLMPDLFQGEAEAEEEGDGEEGEEEEEAAVVVDGGEAARLRALLAPFILRRLKSEVASQLVPKTRETVRLAMLPAQDAAYRGAVAALRAEAAGVAGGGGDETTDAGAALVRALGSARAASSFTLLRKLAQHPLLTQSGAAFPPAALEALAAAAAAAGTYGTDDPARVRDHFAGLSDADLAAAAAELGGRWARAHALPPGSVAAGSAKARYLADLLPRLKEGGHRVLLFSQWTMVLDLLERLLNDAGLSWSRLDGGTPSGERLALVDAFNGGDGDSHFAMLLSTGAGGQGLNLTGADTVIIHDAAWNPAVDRQAEDRAHRLGATRPVRVIRLVTAGTVDEGVVAVSDRKAALADAVLGEGGDGQADGETAAEMGALLAQALQARGGSGEGGRE